MTGQDWPRKSFVPILHNDATLLRVVVPANSNGAAMKVVATTMNMVLTEGLHLRLILA